MKHSGQKKDQEGNRLKCGGPRHGDTVSSVALSMLKVMWKVKGGFPGPPVHAYTPEMILAGWESHLRMRLC